MAASFNYALEESQLTNIMLRIDSVRVRTGLSRSSIYAYVRCGLLPRPVKLGLRASGWPSHEIDAFNAALIAGKTHTEIRKLVKRLEAARSVVA